ncbi:MAG TPA: HAD-IIIC family phosphatase [bacterium]|nr:HAD-IIIC family phosphatase [bacterium]
MKFREICNELERLTAENSNCPAFSVAFLSNVTMEPVFPFIKYFLCRERFAPAIVETGFDNILQEVSKSESNIYHEDVKLIVLNVKLEAFSEILSREFMSAGPGSIESEEGRLLDYIETVIEEIRKRSAVPVALHNFEIPVFTAGGVYDSLDAGSRLNSVRKLNFRLMEKIEKTEGVYIVDADRVQSHIGYDDYFDSRYWHIGRSPYTNRAAEKLSHEYLKILRALYGKTKKCLVLDCDNTLWGGVIGEDGMGGIAVGHTYPGSAFRDFQYAVKELYDRGIMLALCSKNNPADVMQVLEEHPDMVLRKEHFVAFSINWDNKTDGLKEIARELNIGPDSMVFLDDSDFEVSMVKNVLPQVVALKMPDDPSLYRDMLLSCGYFDSLVITEEDRNRSGMYFAETKRKSAAGVADSIMDYFESLEMEIEIRFADEYSIPRISQLTQRTNQFNLTTRRYSETDIRNLSRSENADVLSLRLKDKFGDSGIVGAAILRYEGDLCEIDTFLLSCRVIGRGAEDVLLSELFYIEDAGRCLKMKGVYAPTEKNGQTLEFYPSRGFELIEDTENRKVFCRDIVARERKIPEYFKKVTVNDSVVFEK